MCKEGYEHAAINEYENVCVKLCPEGFGTSGYDYCVKPQSYERTEYYIYNSCLQDNPNGCQAIGISWYPKCKENFFAKGAYCMPSCPDDMSEFRKVMCSRPTYDRFKQPPIEGCQNNKTLLVDGKCYE